MNIYIYNSINCQRITTMVKITIKRKILKYKLLMAFLYYEIIFFFFFFFFFFLFFFFFFFFFFTVYSIFFKALSNSIKCIPFCGIAKDY